MSLATIKCFYICFGRRGTSAATEEKACLPCAVPYLYTNNYCPTIFLMKTGLLPMKVIKVKLLS